MNFKQTLLNELDFKAIMMEDLDDIDGTEGVESLYRLVFVLSITTGLPLDYFKELKWADLVKLGSDNQPIPQNELKGRNYHIPLHECVGKKICSAYRIVGYPSGDSKLFEKEPSNFYSNIVVSGYLYESEDEFSLDFPDDKRDIEYQYITQFIFGQLVFKTNGYSNDVAKRLKLHFKLNKNQELMNFLGYQSKSEIDYTLSKIKLMQIEYEDLELMKQPSSLSIDRTKILDDSKNFNNSSDDKNQFYPFQSFVSFANFLLSRKHQIKSSNNSIQLLLLLSLFNGVRPSTLLKLKWKDLVNLENDNLQIKRYVHFQRFNLKLPYELRIRLKHQLVFNYLHKFEGVILNNKKDIFSSSVQLKLFKSIDLNQSVFISSRGNPLTQPSINREIKNYLKSINFPHFAKYTSKSTRIMFGRRVIEMKGDHKLTIKLLKQHFKCRSLKELCKFLHIDYRVSKGREEFEFKGKGPQNIFDSLFYNH